MVASYCRSFFAEGRAGAKLMGPWTENYVEILKQHLKISLRKLKLAWKWVYQMDNPKHMWQNVSRTTKSRYLSGYHKALILIHVGRTERACAIKEADSYNKFRANGLQFYQFTVRNLWKSAKSIWYKFNNLKVMLPNNVCFNPTHWE